jgi:cardiolipin synthase A/B
MATVWAITSVVGYLLTLLLIPVVLLTKRPHPVSSVAWIMIIFALPYVGGMLFVVFGINRVERRARRKQQYNRTIARHLPPFSQYEIIPGEGLSRQQQRLMRLTRRVAGTRPMYGNRIELLADTNRTLGLIEQAILSARETLHLEYYIWQPDRTGTRLRDLLIRKAQEGVAVRFLYDGFGSAWLTRRFLRPMYEAGIEVATFLPGETFRERWSINLRSHRKIVIVDGRVGFTGGMNIGDEYHGRAPATGYWRDTHLKMQGPAVLQLQQVFVEDWYYATGRELTDAKLFPKPDESGRVLAQVLAGGPDGDEAVFQSVMFAAINEAQEEILLATSFFVPPVALVAALESAAYRGVRVRLLLSERGTFLWTLLAGRSYYDSLLRAGVEIYEYHGGLLHSKTLTIDGSWSLVGSPNFDMRSLVLNFEAAVAIYDSRIAGQLADHFESDLKRATRIEADTWQYRPVSHRLGESLCRLFAPVL